MPKHLGWLIKILRSYYNLTSMSTPAGISIDIKASTVAWFGDNTSITPGLYFYLGSWKKVALEDTAIISNEFVSGGDSTSINN